MPGHLFVLHGDLAAIACHDVLVPCDGTAMVSGHFAGLVGRSAAARGLVRGLPGVARVDREPVLLSGSDGARRVWLMNTAAMQPDGERDVAWLLEQVRTAIRQIAEGGRGPGNRARRLVALPSVGLGAGGFAGRRGEVIDGLLGTLQDLVDEPDAPDVAWVLYGRADYDIVQARRSAPPVRTNALAETMDGLGARAAAGEITFFLGAGVSSAAGLPSWRQLLERLVARTAGLAGGGQSKPLDVQQVLSLPAPDAASVIEARFPAGGLTRALRAELRTTAGHALAHGLVASMRPAEVITTNYDDLYERAAAVPFGRRIAVLPADRARPGEPWLLKLHGDLRDPHHPPVLTRDHYLRFDSDSSPLASVVQSRLLTRHVVFLGYSLADDNFVRLARQVRQLLRGRRRSKVGTVLTLGPEPARELLWREDLAHVSAVASIRDHDTLPAARELEILLDRMAWAARGGLSYVLDEHYRELTDPGDAALVDALRGLAEARAASPDVTPRLGAAVDELLGELGGGRGS